MKDAVAQDAGVVYHAIDAPELVDRRFDDALGTLRIGDAVAVGYGSAPGLGDLGDDPIGNAKVGALAIRRAT